jgi:hypothetical protein
MLECCSCSFTLVSFNGNSFTYVVRMFKPMFTFKFQFKTKGSTNYNVHILLINLKNEGSLYVVLLRHVRVSVMVMEFNATFNSISAISWWSVSLVEETGVSGENHRQAASH